MPISGGGSRKISRAGGGTFAQCSYYPQQNYVRYQDNESKSVNILSLSRLKPKDQKSFGLIKSVFFFLILITSATFIYIFLHLTQIFLSLSLKAFSKKFLNDHIIDNNRKKEFPLCSLPLE